MKIIIDIQSECKDIEKWAVDKTSWLLRNSLFAGKGFNSLEDIGSVCYDAVMYAEKKKYGWKIIAKEQRKE